MSEVEEMRLELKSLRDALEREKLVSMKAKADIEALQKLSVGSEADSDKEGDEDVHSTSEEGDKQPSVVYLSQGQRIDRFCDRPTKPGDPSVQEWIRDVRSQLEVRRLGPKDQASLILNHLGGKARKEIAGRGDEVQRDPSKIFAILSKVFGDGDTLSQLQQRFFSYRQRDGEDLVACSLELVDLFDRICQLDSSFQSCREKSLRGRLAEAAKDEGVRRELRRLNLENPNMTFFDARDQVMEWIGVPKSLTQGKFTVHKLEADSEYHHLIKQQGDQIKAQQQQIDDLIQALKTNAEKSSRPNYTHGGKPSGTRRCYQCDSKFHFKRDCPDNPMNRQPQSGASTESVSPTTKEPLN